MTCYLHTFSVRGRGRFPVDMLRYDCCYPVTGIGADRLLDTDMKTERTIVLRRVTRTSNWEPTEGRWSSFGWYVIRDSHTVSK